MHLVKVVMTDHNALGAIRIVHLMPVLREALKRHKLSRSRNVSIDSIKPKSVGATPVSMQNNSCRHNQDIISVEDSWVMPLPSLLVKLIESTEL